jgi:hypothetical protein
MSFVLVVLSRCSLVSTNTNERASQALWKAVEMWFDGGRKIIAIGSIPIN